MINCEKVMLMLSAYIDNELNEIDKHNIEKHLKTCSNCTKELNELKQIINMVADFGNEDLPVGFGEKLHNKLLDTKEAEKKKNGIVILRNKYIKICSTIAAGLILSFVLKDYFSGSLFGGAKSSLSKSGNMAMSQEARNTESAKAFGSDNNTVLDNIAPKADSSNGASMKSSDQVTTGSSAKAATLFDNTAGVTESNGASKEQDLTARSIGPNPLIPNVQLSQDIRSNFTIESTGELADKNHNITALAPEDARISDSSSMYKDTNSEDRQIKKLPVTITVNNMTNSMAQIREYAATNKFGVYEKNIASQSERFLSIKLNEADYVRFIEFINSIYGASNITYGIMEVIDADVQIQSLSNRVNELNTKIAELKSMKKYDSNELNLLITERDNLRVQIENLTMDAGYIFINLNLYIR